MKTLTEIGFIGTGTMGTLVAEIVAKNVPPDTSLHLANRTPAKAEALAKKIGGTATSPTAIAKNCHLIFLGMKPQMLDEALEEIAPALKSRSTPYALVSMLAGVTCQTLAEKSGATQVIRIMPNTPLSVGEGVIQYCGLGVEHQELATFALLLQGAGLVDAVLESQMDAASAVSGCGPAFCALMLEALADGGVLCGLPREKALAYAGQTLLGTGKLLLEGGQHPGQMKDKVCSPGGSTIRGVAALEENAFRSAVIQAVTAAYNRNKELG